MYVQVLVREIITVEEEKSLLALSSFPDQGEGGLLGHFLPPDFLAIATGR